MGLCLYILLKTVLFSFMVISFLGPLVILVVVWFSMYSVFWIQSMVPAQAAIGFDPRTDKNFSFTLALSTELRYPDRFVNAPIFFRDLRLMSTPFCPPWWSTRSQWNSKVLMLPKMKTIPPGCPPSQSPTLWATSKPRQLSLSTTTRDSLAESTPKEPEWIRQILCHRYPCYGFL